MNFSGNLFAPPVFNNNLDSNTTVVILGII